MTRESGTVWRGKDRSGGVQWLWIQVLIAGEGLQFQDQVYNLPDHLELLRGKLAQTDGRAAVRNLGGFKAAL